MFQGSPSVGAEVKLIHVDANFLRPVENPECGCDGLYTELERIVDRLDRTARPKEVGTTDQSGAFSLQIDTEGPWTLMVRSADGGVAMKHVSPGELGSVDVELEPGVTVSGKILLEDQTDASAAQVVLMSSAGFIAEVKPAADGAFTVGPVPRTEIWVVGRARGLLTDYRRAAAVRPVELTLYKPRTVRGTAYRDSTPLAGARVGLGTGNSAITTRTANDGTFQLSGARPGAHELQVNAGELYGSEMIPVSHDSTEIPAINIVVSQARYVTFKAVDEAQAPVPNVNVQLSGDGWFRRRAVTSADGLVRVGPVPPGGYAAEVYPPRHIEPRMQQVRVEQQDVEVRFVLRPAAQFRGVVTDSGGNRVAGAELLVSRVARSEVTEDGTGVGLGSTERDGSFDIRNLTPGKYRVSVTHRSHVPLSTEIELPTNDARLTFAHAVKVRGTVSAAKDRPVPSVELRFEREGAPPTQVRAETNAEGNFELLAAEGAYAVKAERETFYGHGVQPLAISPERVVVEASSAGSVRFSILDQATISGRVLDAEGAPIKHAKVLARPDIDRPWPDAAQTGDDGSFQLELVRDGAYTLEASAPGFSRTQLPAVQAGQAGLELRLAMNGLIRGRVVDDQHQPVTNFVVNFNGVRSVDGRFELPSKGTRDTTLLVRANGYAASRNRVHTVQGSIMDVGEVVLTRGRKITGVIKDERGSPVAGAAVRIGEGRMAPVEAVKTSGSGAFVLDRTPSERTTLLVEHERYLPQELPLEPNQERLEITLSRGARIFGTFVGATGAPIAGVGVSARSPGRDMHATTNTDGKFEISGLSAGRWLVQSYIPGKNNPWSDWRLVTLKKNAAVELKLDEAARATELRVIVEAGERNGRLTLAPADAPTPKTYGEMEASGPMFFGHEGGGTLKAVPPGTYTVFLWELGRHLRVARQRIKVERRGVQEVRLKFELPKEAPTTDDDEDVIIDF